MRKPVGYWNNLLANLGFVRSKKSKKIASSRQTRNHHHRSLRMETMEERQLLSISSFSTIPIENLPAPQPVDLSSQVFADFTHLDNRTQSIISPELNQVKNIIQEIIANHEDPRSSANELIHVDFQGKIQVYVYMQEIAPNTPNLLLSAGLQTEIYNADMKIIQGWVSFADLDQLATIPGVLQISPPCYGIPSIGSVNTAGDEILRASSARLTYGVDGTNVKVGVISDGVNHIASIQASGDLPSSITIDPLHPGDGDEGTAMLEIIHDLAPGAQLYFSSPNTSLEMSDCINWLADQGCQVIVDDLGFFDQPYFQNGTIAQTVDNVIQTHDITYVTAAGNDALKHYQGMSVVGQGYQSFHPGDTVMAYSIPTDGTLTAFMQWSDEWGHLSNNYDLELWTLAGSTWYYVGTFPEDTQNPFVGGTFENNSPYTTFGLRIWKGNNTDIREIEIYTPNNTPIDIDDTNSADSAFAQAALTSVISVGAINAQDAGNDTVAYFSSHGPATIYTNFATQSRVLLDNIDGCGIDGVHTAIGDLPLPLDEDFPDVFYGTSAAAPHVAAIAALMLDANPLLTSDNVEAILKSGAIDLTSYGNGYDSISGYGRFDALNSVATALQPTLYWDADGNNSSAIGGTGTWNSNASLWRVGSQTGPLTTWIPGSTAMIKGSYGTITIETGYVPSVNSITFDYDPGLYAENIVGSSINFTGSTSTTINVITNIGVLPTNISSNISVSGNGILTKSGPGPLVLGGANTFTGGTIINAGTLKAGANSNVSGGVINSSPFGKGAMTVNSGYLGIGSYLITVPTLSGSGSVIGSGTLTVGTSTSGDSTFSGVIGGTLALTKAGTGTLTLTNTNTYTRITTINSGSTLQIGNGGTTGSVAGNITDNGLLIVDRSNLWDFTAYTLSGNGSVTKRGSGELILNNLILGPNSVVSCEEGILTVQGIVARTMNVGYPMGSAVWTTQLAATLNGSSEGLTYALLQAPTGMSVDSTGLISWTPGSGQIAGETVVAEISDGQGHNVQVAFDVNHAPVLTSVNPSPAIGPVLGSTTKDQPFTTNISSFINNGTGTTTISDSDETDEVGGIAITYTVGLGTWEYSLDGVNFQQFSVVDARTSLMLPPEAKLRYTPDGINSGTAIISYKAWDMSAGVSGERVDLSNPASCGDAMAFSTELDSAQLFINDAPVLTPANPTLGTISHEATLEFYTKDKFINHGAGTTTVIDPNANAKIGGIVIVGITGNGTWEYKPRINTPFMPIGSASLSSALLIIKDASRLRYIPSGDCAETATITYYAWDSTSGINGNRVDLTQPSVFGPTSAFSDACDTASITVTGDAPQLYWDPAGVSGGDGVWDGGLTDTYWHYGSPTGSLAAWVDGADAIFGACGGTPGQVTISNNVRTSEPIKINSLVFEDDGYSLVGQTSADGIALSASGTIVDVEDGSATLACKLVDAALSDGSLVKTGDGTLILSGQNSYSGNTTVNGGELRFNSGSGNTPLIDIEAGKAVFATTNVSNSNLNIKTNIDAIFEIDGGNHVVGDITGDTANEVIDAGIIQVGGGGQLTAKKIFQDELSIGSGAAVTLADMRPASLQLRVFLNSLDLQGSTSNLDLNDAGMIITNANYADVVSRVRQAYNELNYGWWDGYGITSSVAKNDTTQLTCLGIQTGDELLNYCGISQFLGKDVTNHPNWVLVRPTVWGDSNFDGATTDLDYGFINYAYLGGEDSAMTWMWGDYNYDGLIDATDYGYIDFGYGSAAQYLWQ